MTNPRYLMSSEQLTKTFGWSFVLVSGSALGVVLGDALTWNLFSSTYFNRMAQRPPAGTIEAYIHTLLGTPESAYPVVAVVVMCSFAVVWFGSSYRTSRLLGWHLFACGLANVAMAIMASLSLPVVIGSTSQYFAPQGLFSDLSYRANYGGLLFLGFSVMAWLALLAFLSLMRRRIADARSPARASWGAQRLGGGSAKPAAG